MKLFDEWLNTHEPSYSSNPKVWMEEAFRAGMLAAADIAYTGGGVESYDEYEQGRCDAAKDIRQAAE